MMAMAKKVTVYDGYGTPLRVNADGKLEVAAEVQINAVKLKNAAGDEINPLTEETFNSKIPQPIVFDSDGSVKVKVMNEIHGYDANNDWYYMNIKYDDVGLAKDITLKSNLPRNLISVGGVSLTGRDWSADFEKLQNIDTQLSTRASEETLVDLFNATKGMVVLGLSDVQVSTEHDASYTNLENMFDKNIYTYGTLTLNGGGEFIVLLDVPHRVSGITIVGGDTSTWSNISYEVDYDDGTQDSGTVIAITDIGGFIPTNPFKQIISFSLKNYTENNYSINIYEFWIYTAVNVSAFNNILKINGVKLTPRDWSMDFEKLQNIDTQLSTRASEKTQINEGIVELTKQGKVWIANDHETGIADGDSMYYLIDATAAPMLLKYVDIHTEGDMILRAYVNPDITDEGEDVIVHNARDDISTTPTTIVKKYPSWNDMGTVIETLYISGNGSYAFPFKAFQDRIMSKKYLIEIKNVSGNNLQHITVTMKFVEGVV